MNKFQKISIFMLLATLISQAALAKSCNSSCKPFIKISAYDINKASRKSAAGLILDKSGNYKLCDNVNWDPKRSNATAITIAANDVTLDLDGHFINQVDTSRPNNTAVTVSPNTYGITIKNGSLSQLSATGVTALAGVSNINISNINVERCGYNGSITLTVPPVGDVSASGGIYFVGTSTNFARDLSVNNCNFHNLGLLDEQFVPFNAVAGIGAVNASDLKITNITADSIFGDFFSTPFIIFGGSDLYLSNLVSSNITGNREAVGGASINVCTNSVLEDIAVTGVTLTLSSNSIVATSGAEGVKFETATNFVLRRASFSGIKVQSTEPVIRAGANSLVCNGISIANFVDSDIPNENGLIEDVVIVGLESDGGITPTNNARAAAVTMDGTHNTTIRNCYVSGVRTSVGHAFAYGSKIVSANPRRNPYNTFDNCVAENVEITGDGEYAAGFLLSADQEHVINCTANRILDLREDPAAYGIILDTFATGEATECFISNNTLTECSTAGIFDNTAAQNSVITGNYAALNGPGGTQNYLNLNAFVPVVTWSPYLTSAPPATTTAFDNLDISN